VPAAVSKGLRPPRAEGCAGFGPPTAGVSPVCAPTWLPDPPAAALTGGRSPGQRPDLEMTRELRLDLDPWLESPRALGPMIDPNLHSCGTVPPHGHRELAHPEPGYYAVGIKSYGRAPTFLMATGYEQVRSVAARLAGDHAAADDVRLVLPETGVCSVNLATAASAKDGCRGAPAPASGDACCVDDPRAKAGGKAGCGCDEAASPPELIAEKAACCGARP
jgi:hypothetical protein